jgi:hypothetical protein
VLSRQIQQANLLAFWLGHSSFRQQLAYRLIESDSSLRGHLREQQAGEGLGHGTDLKHGFRLRGSIRDHAARAMFHHSNGDSRVLPQRQFAACRFARGGHIAIQHGF